MAKRVIFIEHDHASPGGPICKQFERRGYEITRFNIIDEDTQWHGKHVATGIPVRSL